MKYLIAFTLLLASHAFAVDTLHIFTWADYLSPELVKRFEKEHNCKVSIDTYDSNDNMYAKIKAGASGYDLVFPSSYIIGLMKEQAMIQDLDHAKLPNVKNISSDVLEKIQDKKMSHSVPYTMGYAVIGYRNDKVKTAVDSWAAFARTDLKKRMTQLNDMRETIGSGLKFLGYSLNSRDEKQLAEARDVLIQWKRNLAKYDNEGYKAGLDSGEFLLVHGYSGDLWQVAKENEAIALVIPKEGVSIFCDEMVIPTSAPRAELAYAMINFLLDAKVSAENMEFLGCLCPNKEALKNVDKAFLSNPAITIPAELKAKCEVIEDLGADLAKYTKVWDELKAAK